MNKLKKYSRYFFLFLAGSLAILALSSTLAKIEAYYHSGRSIDSAHPGHEVLRNDAPSLEWIGDETNNSNDYIKKQISKQYRDGWMWLNSSLSSGNWRGIEDYYTSDMSEGLKRKSDNSSYQLDGTALMHKLSLKHISIDFSLAIFTDSMTKYQCIDLSPNQVFCSARSHEMEVYMQLQDDRWKVFNWKEVKSDPRLPSEQKVNKDFSDNLLAVQSMKGINYYPQNSPWINFWNDYDSLIIETDFEKIKDIGFNTVRVFLTMDNIGRNEIDHKTIKKLDHLIMVAEKYDLRLLPTLFDFPIGFEITKFPTYIRQIEYIIDRYKEDQTILAWNLKNEPDLDFAIYNKEEILRWAKLMLGSYRRIDVQHPVTIGWANIENVSLLADELDYVSFHHYTSITELEKLLSATDYSKKPLVIEEFGIPSNKSIWNLYQNSEAKQEMEVKKRINYYEENNLPWLLWTLSDFEEAPVEVFSRNPILRNKQKGFGILKNDGQEKTVSTFIRGLLKEESR